MAPTLTRRYDIYGLYVEAGRRQGEDMVFYDVNARKGRGGPVVMVFRVIQKKRQRWVSTNYPDHVWYSLEQAITYTIGQEWSGV